MQINKINFTPMNCNSYKRTPQNSIIYGQQLKTEYHKYSTNNLKANYLIHFKGNVQGQNLSNSGIGGVNHETHFFREPKTDEIVQNYILNNFSNDSEINIVSGACSSGEEAKSYAMMLDSLGDKLHISGFDISDEIIQQADSDTVRLIIDTSNLLFNDTASEKFLIDDDYDSLTPYQKKCREKFETYYEKSGKPYKEPAFPDAQKQLDELNETLNDKEKYEEEKRKYYEQINILKEKFANDQTPDEAGLAEILEAFSFNEANVINRMVLKQRAGIFYIFQDFKLKEHALCNCEFKQGDIINLEELYSQNSVNVLLYRNALYHTLCKGNNMLRVMNDDAQEKMASIAKQMNKIIKTKGLVVFGEEESLQGIDNEVIKESMTNNGFKQYVHNGKELSNIWVKIEDII